MRLTNQLESSYNSVFPGNIQELEHLLARNEIACIVAYPVHGGMCLLWQFRELKEQFELVPLVVACPCVHFDFIHSCSETVADECLSFEGIDQVRERVEMAIDRRSFRQHLELRKPQVPTLPPRVKKALCIIHSKFTRLRFAEDVSQRLGISVTTFRREFRQSCGVTFTRYLIATKLFYASYLAQNTGLTAKAIADRCGFSDEHDFYRCFKKKVGMPFSKYRAGHIPLNFDRFMVGPPD